MHHIPGDENQTPCFQTKTNADEFLGAGNPVIIAIMPLNARLQGKFGFATIKIFEYCKLCSWVNSAKLFDSAR